MIEFQVGDMTCGHCVGRVTKAVKDVDAAATVNIDLDKKRVSIDSGHGPEEFQAAIAEAGYTPKAA
jgi:copper chaperone